MKILITLRGPLTKKGFFGEEKEKEFELPEGISCGEALKLVGIDWENIPIFGFVAVNNMRVMINSPLKDGDVLKAYPRISGG